MGKKVKSTKSMKSVKSAEKSVKKVAKKKATKKAVKKKAARSAAPSAASPVSKSVANPVRAAKRKSPAARSSKAATGAPRQSGRTVSEIMTELKSLAKESTRRTLERHGAKNIFGVLVGDLKKVARTIKGDQSLALELYDTGNGDAQYLAGMIADGAQMTKAQLNRWAKTAAWQMITDYTVPWVTSENPHGRELAMKWINAKDPRLQCSGWNAYSGLVATRPDSELDLDEIRSLLERVEKEIEKAENRVKYNMNNFVISVATYVKPLLKEAKGVARRLGKVPVDVGDTSCKVPVAADYIAKVEARGAVGKKRKTIRC